MVPFPRSHFHWVGFPVELSEKLTTSGAQPDTGVAVKLAESCALDNRLLKANNTQIQLDLTSEVVAIGFAFTG